MNGRTATSASELLGPVLRSVSRSFYVSIRLLPRRLREPIGLAYLLARATDSIADTQQIPAGLRKEMLGTVTAAIQNKGDSESIANLKNSFAPLQSNSAERTLIESLPQCLQLLDQTDSADQRDIRVVLDKITQAQTMDIDRFGGDGAVKALRSPAELQEYTYLIAGCVGEFWTHLCSRHVALFAELPLLEMLSLGRAYGTGLQLVNILRDAHGDLRAGRCYFPAEELAALGLDPSRILDEPARFEPVFRKWLEEGQRGLNAGMQYVAAIKDRRIRGATALPALIGARTIAMLRDAGVTALQQKIKVPRNEVRGMIATVALTLASKKNLERMFRDFRRIAHESHE